MAAETKVSCFNLPSPLRRRRDSNTGMVAGFRQRMALMGITPAGPPEGSPLKRANSSPFALMQHSHSDPLPGVRIKVEPGSDEIPGGLAGMRARMAAMGHTSNSQSDVFTDLKQNQRGQAPSHTLDPIFNQTASSSPTKSASPSPSQARQRPQAEQEASVSAEVLGGTRAALGRSVSPAAMASGRSASADANPDGLAGMRARMAAMGHTVEGPEPSPMVI